MARAASHSRERMAPDHAIAIPSTIPAHCVLFLMQATLDVHWGKHHRTYVNNLNGQVEGTDMENKSLEEVRLNCHFFVCGVTHLQVYGQRCAMASVRPGMHRLLQNPALWGP